MCKIVPRYALHHRVASSRVALFPPLAFFRASLYLYPPRSSISFLDLHPQCSSVSFLSLLCSLCPCVLSSHLFSVSLSLRHSQSLYSFSFSHSLYINLTFTSEFIFFVTFLRYSRHLFFRFISVSFILFLVYALSQDDTLYSFVKTLVVYKHDYATRMRLHTEKI